jgi:hypothetical protein
MSSACTCHIDQDSCVYCYAYANGQEWNNHLVEELEKENKQLQNRIDELEKYVDDNENYKKKWLTLNSWIVNQEKSLKGDLGVNMEVFTGTLELPSGMSITARDFKEEDYATFTADDVPVGGNIED